MKRFGNPVMLLLILAGFSGPASSPVLAQSVLYEQLPLPFGGATSDGQTITVADDFRLTSPASLQRIVWWGAYSNSPVPIPTGDAFTLRIYDDGGGQPGSVLAIYTIGAESRVTQVGPAAFEYAIDLPAPLALEAGTYWLSIVNVPTSESWGWLSSSYQLEQCQQGALACSRRSFSGPTGPWDDVQHNNYSFRLLGEATGCAEVAIGLRIEPDVINLRTGGRWVSAFLEPLAPYTADQIDVTSVQLFTSRGTIVPDPDAPGEIGDADGNGVADLMLKFKRSDVIGILDGNPTSLVVVGEFLEPATTCFRGSDEVRVVPVEAPGAGEALTMGQTTAVEWEPANDLPPHTVDLLVSRDDGDTWTLDAQGLADDGHHAWTAHGADGDRIRIAVVMVRNANGGQDVRIGVSERFSILIPTGIDDPPAVSLGLRAPHPQPARAGAPLSVSFTLPDSRPASLTVHDIAGRRMAAREVGRLGAGRHSVTFATDRLRAGVYLIRLARAGESRETRVVLIP